jgi:hypothetical protein
VQLVLDRGKDVGPEQSHRPLRGALHMTVTFQRVGEGPALAVLVLALRLVSAPRGRAHPSMPSTSPCCHRMSVKLQYQRISGLPYRTCSAEFPTIIGKQRCASNQAALGIPSGSGSDLLV